MAKIKKLKSSKNNNKKNKKNGKLEKDIFNKIKGSLLKRKDVRALIRMQNVLSLKRINYPDHGMNHVKIVARNSLRIFELLSKAGIKTTTQIQHKFSEEDVKIILFFSSILHDIGMSVDREFHEVFSVIIAKDIIFDELSKFYDTQKTIILQSEILHAIFSHRRKGKPKTMEAEILRLADGLDIAKGRSKMLIDSNQSNIHFISSFSIEKVEIEKGKETPIEIKIEMSNPAGFFLVSEFLKEKIKETKLSKHIKIKARIKGQKNFSIL